ncbi:MAG: abortive infection family protein [Acidobacteriota bacterium]
MITLYGGRGSGGFSIEGDAMPDAAARILKNNVAKVLRSRGNTIASAMLLKFPFRLFDATNDSNDEFSVLVARVPLARYEELRKIGGDADMRHEIAAIARVATELGTYVRFVAADLAMSTTEPDVSGLTRAEIHKLVNNYIGVQSGYLGDFSYRSHHEFYVELDLEVDPNDLPGTTRERFIQILADSTPADQAKILGGVLSRFPIGSSPLRTQARADLVESWIRRLRSRGPVAAAAPQMTTAVVERALADATNLLRTSGPISAVDRTHTALHGWLKAACANASIPLSADPSITEAIKALREQHPKLQASGARAEEITRVLRALGTVVDSLNTIRNRASVAHANDQLLDEPEAMLVINMAQTVLHFLDAKLSR